MPVIKISSIKEKTRTSQKGKKYKVVEVQGTKYGTNDEWSTDIFKNNTDVIEQLDEFGPGEMANFQFKKNGNFYDLVGVVEPSEDNLEYAKKNADKPVGGKPKGGGGMSKEEWAEKDRKVKIGMAIHNSLKFAVMNTKVNEKPEKIVEMAKEFLPYLTLEELPCCEEDIPFGGNGDPLDPQV